MNVSSCEGSLLVDEIGSSFSSGFGPVGEVVCLETGLAGLVVDVGGGEFPEDVSWSLTFPSGIVETGIAGSFKSRSCISPYPSPQPSVSFIPTAPCEFYTFELYDSVGDG